ncbi:unnamed protein product [Pelagomonas calceolata]|uniref:Uncharacterized protein n=1 Tax=Pelagomonas calceolata TaxID=35677 RepID=A0A8J2S5E2_9STRA|nr:unnamed protein product [Pelagomonas calceolata]
MGGWVQVVNESSLILINGCLCCNASLYADFPECCGASCKGELCCCVKRCCFKAGVPPLTCCESFVDKEVCCQCGLCCCALGCKCPSTCIKHQGQCCCVVNNIACPRRRGGPADVRPLLFRVPPRRGPASIAPRLAAHATSPRALRYLRAHERALAVPPRAPGAPPAIEVMDGKEEVFVVEAQPGSVSAVASLESLDVVDKLPDSVATPFAMDVMER